MQANKSTLVLLFLCTMLLSPTVAAQDIPCCPCAPVTSFVLPDCGLQTQLEQLGIRSEAFWDLKTGLCSLWFKSVPLSEPARPEHKMNPFVLELTLNGFGGDLDRPFSLETPPIRSFEREQDSPRHSRSWQIQTSEGWKGVDLILPKAK